MQSRVDIVMASHLSDVEMEMDFNQEQAKIRLNFVKWLINHYPDTSVYFDPNEEYSKFRKHYGI